MDVSYPGGLSVVDPGGLSPGYAHQPGVHLRGDGVNLQGGILRAPLWRYAWDRVVPDIVETRIMLYRIWSLYVKLYGQTYRGPRIYWEAGWQLLPKSATPLSTYGQTRVKLTTSRYNLDL